MNLKTVIKDFVNTVQADSELRKKYFYGNENAFTRNRFLSLERITFHILTRSSRTLDDCLDDEFGNGSKRPDRSAWVKALAKIDISYWKDLSSYILAQSRKMANMKTFNGYHLYAIDSTTLALAPYDRECFQSNMVTHGQVSSYYALHINSLYDVCNDMFIDTVIQKGKELDERKAALEMIYRMYRIRNEIEKQIFLFDRGYPGYNLIAHLIRNGQFFLIRSTNTASIGGTLWEKNANGKKEGSIKVTITLTRLYESTFKGKSGYEDYIYLPPGVKFDFLPEKSPLKHGGKRRCWREVKKALKECSYSLSFRVVRVKIGKEGSKDEYETLITNLSEEEFSPEDLKELYFKRWSQETAFRELKHHEHLLYIHAKRTDFVIAEVYAAIMLHNMTAAASLRAVEIEEEKKRELEQELKELELNESDCAKRRRQLKPLPDEAFGLNHSKAVVAVVCFLRNTQETIKELLKELVRNPVLIKPGRSFVRKLRPRGFIGFTYRAK